MRSLVAILVPMPIPSAETVGPVFYVTRSGSECLMKPLPRIHWMASLSNVTLQPGPAKPMRKSGRNHRVDRCADAVKATRTNAGYNSGHSLHQCTLESGPPAQKWHGSPCSPSLRMFRMLWASAQSVSVDRLRLLDASCPRQDGIASAFKFQRSCLHICAQCLLTTSPVSISRMNLVSLDLSPLGWRDSLLRRYGFDVLR